MGKITIVDPLAGGDPEGCVEVTVRGTVEDDRGFTAAEMAVTARYWGGAYLELFAPVEIDPNGGPFDVINVWDHRAGRPGIDFTPAAVRQTVRDWLADRLAEEVAP